MYLAVFIIILIYFLLGAISVFLITRNKNTEEKRKNWIKYFGYFFIVNLIVLTIIAGWLKFISFLIIISGLFEIIKVWRINSEMKITILISSLLIYSIIAIGFFNFALVKTKDMQLFVYTIVFVFDGFSQITGQLIGKHKLIVKVSPGKTIEGTIGGLVMSLITSKILFTTQCLLFNSPMLFGFAISIAALAGDLLASWFKRINNVKDFSNLIPGHGGILDRFDSFIVAGAIWFLLANY